RTLDGLDGDAGADELDAVDDDPFVAFQPLLDDAQAVVEGADHDGSVLHDVLVVDDVEVFFALETDDGAFGDDEFFAGRADGDARAHEQAGRQGAVLVVDPAAQLEGAGFGVYLRIDEVDDTPVGVRGLVGELHVHLNDGAAGGAVVQVDMQLADQTTYPYRGVINFVDPEVDPKTGTLQLRGRVDNKDGSLSPGLLVRTRVAVGAPGEKLVVTERAIVSFQGKKYLYVVDDKNVVQNRPVVVGTLYNGLRVIEEGLKGDERIIINGIQLVRPGVTVEAVKGS